MATEQDKLFCRMAMKLTLLSREQALAALSDLDGQLKLGRTVRIADVVRSRGDLDDAKIATITRALDERNSRNMGSSQNLTAAAGLPTAHPADGGDASARATAVPKAGDGPIVPPPPPRGTIGPGTVMGKYTLLRKLGEGAMGAVYEGLQQGMARRAAIKVLAHALVANPRAVQRFRREAEAAARLSHPNIVGIFGMGEADSVHYIAMEFVDGITVEALLEKAPLSPQRAAEIIATAGDALHFAHECGVIHRDIKPANLMLTHEGDRVLIADFGLARPEGASQITGAGQLLGTPAYMAPEQASGDHSAVDRRTDVYSLGASLYEMLTMQPPFPGRAVFEVLQKVLEQEPQDPCEISPDVPRPLGDIVLKALAKVAGYRYQTALAMAEDLRTFLRGAPPIASQEAGHAKRGASAGDDAPARGGGFLSRFGLRKKR